MNLRTRLDRAERTVPKILPSQLEEEAYGRYLATLPPEELQTLYRAKMQALEEALTPQQRREREARYERWLQMTPEELLAEHRKLLRRGL